MEHERHTSRIAVCVLLLKDNKVFLIRRKNTGWMDGMYGLPGGHLEANETISEAARREAKEEAGVDIDMHKLTFVHLMHRKEPGNFEYVDVFFVSKHWEGEAQLGEVDLADDTQWCKVENLPENIIPYNRAGIDSFVKKVLYSEFLSDNE